jgi:hypothetical protein
VSLTVSTLVRIYGVADFNFGSYTGSGSRSLDDDVCVWTNADAATYRVTAKGDGTDFAFTVAKDGSNTLAYTVKWNNTTGTAGNTALTANSISPNFSGANTTSQTCGGGNNANLQISFGEAALQAAKPGTYSGVLTIVISPGV